MVEVGRDLRRSSGPTSLLSQDHLEQVVQEIKVKVSHIGNSGIFWGKQNKTKKTFTCNTVVKDSWNENLILLLRVEMTELAIAAFSR